jgi:DNA topoisomerase-1
MTRAQVNGTPLTDPVRRLARSAHLRFSNDADVGFHRRAAGRGFQYVDAYGRVIKSETDLERIRALKIPPAWTAVWICPAASGHIQATGRDARGRKQYLYHEKWSELASRSKFEKLREFCEAFPRLRRHVARDVASPGLTRRRVVAAIIDLLDKALVRVGNEEYARANGSFGLTTLRNKHVKVRGQELRFHFPGKSGVVQEVGVADRRLARIVRQCQELPGQELFQYRGSHGGLHRVESADVNRYLRSVMGQAFSAKDFRTWKATVLVFSDLKKRIGDVKSERRAKGLINQALRRAAQALGNTLTVCRQYYVHPQITDLFLHGRLGPLCRGPIRKVRGLTSDEQSLLAVLQRIHNRGR